MMPGARAGFLKRLAVFLGDSCGSAEVSRRDADDALEVAGEVALIREAGARRDLGQCEVPVGVQELLRPLDPSRDDVLVRRQIF